nr:MAG TPA: hypothetical protein [Caudoviricetes sp.]
MLYITKCFCIFALDFRNEFKNSFAKIKKIIVKYK